MMDTKSTVDQEPLISKLDEENSTLKQTRSRWSRVAPVALLATLIPGSVWLVHYAIQRHGETLGSNHDIDVVPGVLSFHRAGHDQQQQLQKEALAYNYPLSSSSGSGLNLVPTLTLGFEGISCTAIVVTILGLLGLVKGNRKIMQSYYFCILITILIQFGMVLQQFLMSTQWIDEALDRSWDRAFDSDRSLIQELQYEFHCLGFKDAQDRAMPYSSEGVMPQPCAQVMRTMFGKRLQHLGLILLSIRLLQLAGVLLLTVLIKYLAALDQEQREKQEQEEQQQQAEQELARIEAKLGQSQQMEAKLKKDQERDRLLEAEDNEVVTVCVQA